MWGLGFVIATDESKKTHMFRFARADKRARAAKRRSKRRFVQRSTANHRNYRDVRQNIKRVFGKGSKFCVGLSEYPRY